MSDLGEALVWGAAVFVVTLVALGLARVAGWFGARRTIAHLPDAGDRAAHLAHVRAMRRGGASLDECIAALRGRGLKRGVAQSLVLDMEREQPADVAHPREARWNGWAFSYPGNWRLETLVDAAGPEAAISVEGVGSGLFMLLRLDDAQPELEAVADAQAEQLRDPEREPLETWGALRGEGTRYRGPHAKMRLDTELVVFRPAGVDPRFAVVTLHALEEAELVAPGLALIRDSFTRA